MLAKNTNKKIVFVYNANSGLASSMLDSAHKIFSPATYACNLCDITFGVFTENAVWKKFREETALQFEFLHKNEFKAQFPKSTLLDTSLPVVFIRNQEVLEIVISTEELNKMKTAEALIQALRAKIKG